MPSFSLIGALEFRRVVASLQHEAAGNSLNIFDTPISPYPGGHYHQHTSSHHHRMYSNGSHTRTPALSFSDEGQDPWDAALARSHGVPLSQRVSISMDDEAPQDGTLRVPDHEAPPVPPIPAIACTPASPSEADMSMATETSSIPYVPPTRRQKLFRTLSVIWHVLFPTLHNFRSKSFLGMIAAVFAAPAVMALTLTLPVVVSDHEHDGAHSEKVDGYPGGEFGSGRGDVGRLVDFEEEGVGQRTLVADDDVDDDEEDAVHELKFNKWLMAVQCAIAPLFCVSILFGKGLLFLIGRCNRLEY